MSNLTKYDELNASNSATRAALIGIAEEMTAIDDQIFATLSIVAINGDWAYALQLKAKHDGSEIGIVFVDNGRLVLGRELRRRFSHQFYNWCDRFGLRYQ